jgi:hypothetical protein
MIVRERGLSGFAGKAVDGSQPSRDALDPPPFTSPKGGVGSDPISPVSPLVSPSFKPLGNQGQSIRYQSEGKPCPV